MNGMTTSPQAISRQRGCIRRPRTADGDNPKKKDRHVKIKVEVGVRDSPFHIDAEYRPKSGKSLSFGFCPSGGRQTPLSVSTAEYRYLSSRDLKTPVSVTRVARRSARSRDAFASGRVTQMSSIRDGGWSPIGTVNKDMEPAFSSVDTYSRGVTIWRLEKTNLRCMDDSKHGFFHEGNTYIILNIVNPEERTLHYWIGSESSERDRKTIEEKAHKLDKIISTAHLFSREVQGNESGMFLRMFPDGIIYIEGKCKERLSKCCKYDKRLYLVTGRKYARAACVLPDRNLIQSSNILILDGHPRIYVWVGKDTRFFNKCKAIGVAQKIQLRQRDCKCHIVVIDESDKKLSEAFIRKFDEPTEQIPNGNSTVPKSSVELPKPTDDTGHETFGVLYRVNGDSVLYHMAEASRLPLKQCYLMSRDCYLLDRGAGHALFIWVGNSAMEDEVNNAIARARTFSQHYNYHENRAIYRIREDYEPIEFRRCFCDWKMKLSGRMSITKSYTVGNIGRALSSRSDKRTVATLKECWAEETIGDHRRNIKVWVLNNGVLEPWEHIGLFTNDKCFLLLHTTVEHHSHLQYILYYWVGCRASSSDRDTIVQLALQKKRHLEYHAVLIRVLDGREPQHFLSAIEDWMLVYDGEETNSNSSSPLKMFSVRDAGDRALRVQQVRPSWCNLNSAASFLILTETGAFLWYGKNSGSTEREGAKELLAILCAEKLYTAEVITEGKETPNFSASIGSRQPYKNGFKIKFTEQRAPCLIYCQPDNQFKIICNFVQEDLSDDAVYILDSYHQIIVWCGDKVEASRKEQVLDIAESYIRIEPAGRDYDTVAVWCITQRSEPMAFKKYFCIWNNHGYLGRHAYEVLRKRVRQENAKIDITENLVDTTYKRLKHFPYKILLSKEYPEEFDPSLKQHYLSAKTFHETLNMSRDEFYKLPVWKQRQILRSARLLPPSDQIILDP